MSIQRQKLSFLDAAFLRMESATRPFHVAGLMVLKLPAQAPPGYLRRLATRCGRLNELWPALDKKLENPQAMRNPAWVSAADYDPAYHVYHYALPAPGRMDELLGLVSRVHERLLDRDRPLWELHLIEGLPGGRFAIYCKVHHALVDGVGALRMIDVLFSTSPDTTIDFRASLPIAQAHHKKMSLARQLGGISDELRKHTAALPQVYSLLGHMGMDALLGKKDVPPLPFTAPRTIFNQDIDARREIILADLPLKGMKAIGTAVGGTINDALIAVCGGALREYLLRLDELPAESLEAGLPVSIKSAGQSDGNEVGFLFCPFYTDERDPLKRLKRIVKVTKKAKQDYLGMSKTAAQDFTNALMVPTMLATLTGNATRIRPALNAIVSNVPGSSQRLYLDGAMLEKLYPLSIVSDGMGLNFTVISYHGTLCLGMTSCPQGQPGVEHLGKLLKLSYQELSAATKPKRKPRRKS